MRKSKQFEVFGIIYETKQFSAVEALDMVDVLNIVQPDEMLKYTSFVRYDKKLIQLNDPGTINERVKDCLGIVAPKMVLKAVCEIVSEFNFGFLRDWKGTKIPTRFLTSGDVVESSYIEPIIANVTTANMATIKELETYYSLFDLFSMFDALLVKGINEALSNEAAQKEAKNR